MNAFCSGEECFSAGNETVENVQSNFTYTYTANYQRLSNRTYLQTIATYRYSVRILAVAMTLSYSPPSMLHPEVIYSIAFSAQLNGIQVD